MGIQQKSTRLKELYVTVVANIPVIVAGMQVGFPAFIMFQLRKEFGIDMDQISWLVFVGYFSLLFSPIVVTHLITKYGRKTNLRFVLCLFIIGWGIVLISTNFLTLLIGILLSGIAAGTSLPLASIYIAEIARARYRGTLLAMVWLLGVFGTAFVYVIELSMTWRQVVMMILGISAFGIYQLQIIPESKFWHLFKKRKDDALESTAWFENTKVALKETEILYSLMNFGTNMLREDDLDAGKLTWRVLKKLQMKSFLLSVSVNILRCGTGKVLFTVYPINMFTNLGTSINGKILGIGYCVLNFITCMLNMLLFSTIDRFNRKNFFNIFSAVMVVCLTAVICLQSLDDNGVKPLSGVMTLCMYAYLVVEGTGYFSILSIMSFEVMPITQRGVSTTLNFFASNLVSAIYVKVFPIVEQNFSFRTQCVYFLINVLLIFVIVQFYYPDTRGNMFSGYEKHFLKTLKNADVEKLVANDWLRNEALQEFLTGNDNVNVDLINSDVMKNVSKEWAESMREIVQGHQDSVENFINTQEQQMRVIDETKENTPLLPIAMEPINPQEFINTMKNTFSAFMENNPMMNAQAMWNPNSNVMFMNKWARPQEGGSRPKRSTSAKTSPVKPPNEEKDHEV